MGKIISVTMTPQHKTYQPLSRVGTSYKAAASLFSPLTSNWLWVIIRRPHPVPQWNLHAAYVIRVQHSVAQW